MDRQSLGNRPSHANTTGGNLRAKNISELPGISLPKGGGAIKGIDEQFTTNPSNGTVSFGISLPIAARGFTPAIALSYDSGH
jgi:hypothetical protein